jgi:serine/threonine protein kinase
VSTTPDHPPAPGPYDELIGRVLGGRFRLTKQLGVGGMGAVYLATDQETQTDVALKVIRPNLVDDREAIERFQREARAVGGLQHPHIVGFVGAGDDHGVHWLAMEFLRGRSLKEQISTRGAMPWRETLPLLRQMLLGLQAAHERGVIHRDLKPDNVMLCGGIGEAIVVKLLDFGIAKQMNTEGMTMTGTGVVVGTPGFVAPEVIVHGTSNDPRSDLYSVGVMWFEMLTASKPFDAPTPFAISMRHVTEAPPRPTALLPFAPVPAPVEDLLLRLLAKKPEARPATAKALIGMLDELALKAERPIEPASSTVDTEIDLLQSDKTETSMNTIDPRLVAASSSTALLAAPPAPRSRAPLVIGAAAVVVVVAVVAAVVVGGGAGAGNATVDAGVTAVAVKDAGVVVVAPPVVADAGVAEVKDAGVVVDGGSGTGTGTKKPHTGTKKPDNGVTHKPSLDLTLEN